MDLSGLNKALLSLYSEKHGCVNQSATPQEIISSVNIILEKVSEFDQDKIMTFETTSEMLRPLSSSCWEVYVCLTSLINMAEAVDAVEEGFSRLELIERSARPIFDDMTWHDFLDSNGFIRPLAVQHRLKKVGERVIQELHSEHQLECVSFTQDDLDSRKCRFHLSTKHSGTILIYLVPSVEIDTRPRCIRADLLPMFGNNKVLLTADLNSCLQWDPNYISLWYISTITVENKVLNSMDKDGGLRHVVRDLLQFLCEKYVHYPVTRKVIDALLVWNISGYKHHEEWTQDKLAERILELLENLRRCLRNHRVRDYFVPFKNMVDHVDGIKLDKAAERLEILITKLHNDPYCLKVFDIY